MFPENLHKREEKGKWAITHKRSFEHVFGHEDLIRWVDSSGLDGALLDLDHTVDAGEEDSEDGGSHGLDHDRASPSLDTIQAQYHEFP